MESDGAVLVRPDGVIAWRARGTATEPEVVLRRVLAQLQLMFLDDAGGAVRVRDEAYSATASVLSSAFDDTQIPLRGLVEHFEGWLVQVTIVRGYRLL